MMRYSLLNIKLRRRNYIRTNKLKSESSMAVEVIEKITESFYDFSTKFFEGSAEHNGVNVVNGVQIITANDRIHYWYFNDSEPFMQSTRYLKTHSENDTLLFKLYAKLYNYILISFELGNVKINSSGYDKMKPEDTILAYKGYPEIKSNITYYPVYSEFLIYTLSSKVKANLKIFWEAHFMDCLKFECSGLNLFINDDNRIYFPRIGSIF